MKVRRKRPAVQEPQAGACPAVVPHVSAEPPEEPAWEPEEPFAGPAEPVAALNPVVPPVPADPAEPLEAEPPETPPDPSAVELLPLELADEALPEPPPLQTAGPGIS